MRPLIACWSSLGLGWFCGDHSASALYLATKHDEGKKIYSRESAMPKSRIPSLQGTTEEEARTWLLAMREAGLLFDLYDDAAWIIHRDTGEAFFTSEEAEKTNGILERLVDALGNRLDEIAYQIFMEAFGRDPCPEDGNNTWEPPSRS